MLLLATVGALLATTLVLVKEIWHGKLAVPAVYDDVHYLLRGLEIYDTFHDSASILRFILAWPALDMHSPVADLQAFLGFMLFGDNVTGVYALAAVYVGIFLWYCMKLFEERPLFLKVSVCLFILSTPFVLFVIRHLKSDYAGGMFFILAAMSALGVYTASSSRARTAQTVIFASLAILSKPSGFHIPVILAGVLVLGVLMQQVEADARPTDAGVRTVLSRLLLGGFSNARAMAARLAVLLIAILALVYVFMLGRFEDLLNYIVWNMDSSSGFYDEPRGVVESLLYRLPVSGRMQGIWGAVFHVFVLLLVAGNWRIFVSDDVREKIRTFFLFLVFLVTYAAVIVNPFPNLSFSALFFFSTLGYSVYLLSRLTTGLSRGTTYVVGGLLMASLLFATPQRIVISQKPSHDAVARINTVCNAIVGDINRLRVTSILGSGLATSPINSETLRLYSRMRRLPGHRAAELETIWISSRSITRGELEARLARADMFIGADRPLNRHAFYAWLEDYPFQTALDFVAEKQGWVQVGRYGLLDGVIFVYAKRSLVDDAGVDISPRVRESEIPARVEVGAGGACRG